MLRHRVPRSTLRVPQALRVGLPPYIFGTVTRSAQGILNRCQLPDEHIEPLFDTSHLAQAPTLTFLKAVAREFQTNYRRVAASAHVPKTTVAQQAASRLATRPDLYGTSLADIQGAIFGKGGFKGSPQFLGE
jgi:hypothetical protein